MNFYWECSVLTLSNMSLFPHTLMDIYCSSRSADVSVLGTQVGISDDNLIGFSLPPSEPTNIVTVSYWNFKSIHPISFSAALDASSLSSSIQLSCRDQILSLYNPFCFWNFWFFATLRRSCHSSPWCTPERRAMKAAVHQQERLYKKTSISIHSQL